MRGSGGAAMSMPLPLPDAGTGLESSFSGKFTRDTAKVTYTCSYLSNVAFSWYDNFVTSTSEPSWIHDFALFKHKLGEQFGSINAEAIAERKINQLKMKSGDSISNYITNFTSIKNDVEQNNAALSFAFKRLSTPKFLESLGLDHQASP